MKSPGSFIFVSNLFLVEKDKKRKAENDNNEDVLVESLKWVVGRVNKLVESTDYRTIKDEITCNKM